MVSQDFPKYQAGLRNCVARVATNASQIVNVTPKQYMYRYRDPDGVADAPSRVAHCRAPVEPPSVTKGRSTEKSWGLFQL